MRRAKQSNSTKSNALDALAPGAFSVDVSPCDGDDTWKKIWCAALLSLQVICVTCFALRVFEYVFQFHSSCVAQLVKATP